MAERIRARRGRRENVKMTIFITLNQGHIKDRGGSVRAGTIPAAEDLNFPIHIPGVVLSVFQRHIERLNSTLQPSW
ncbi:MAG: hypothetical protein ABR985_17255 [Methanotrichaceae archaeon]|jgi:hypothetical protein